MEKNNSFNDFLSVIQKKHDKNKKFKISNSYGIYDGYKYYRKTKKKEKEYILTESQYFSITRKINNILRDLITNGEDIRFPYNMGELGLKKFEPTLKIKEGKVYTTRPIDWNRTVKLWYEDKEAYENKYLIRYEDNEIFKIYYRKGKAKFKNKSFYKFIPNRELKRILKNNIKEGIVNDAFLKK